METAELPIQAETLLPHRPPLLMIDRLLACEGLEGTVESILKPGNPFLNGEGLLYRPAMVELVAQSFAAIKGFADRREGKPAGKGFLVGVKRFAFFHQAKLGQRLLIRIIPTGETEEFGLAQGRIHCGDTLLAEGTVMVFVPKEI
jgi:predicted hotdog family 3-hydroxylacyl-ACP dehydratase